MSEDDVPYIGFTNKTLEGQPKAKRGDLIACPRCRRTHELEGGISDGEQSDLLLFYQCGKTSYLAAVDGRFVMGVKPDFSGQAPGP